MSKRKPVVITKNIEQDVDPRHDDLHLSVDDRKDKPFHCDYHGNTYEPCCHWSPKDKWE